MANLSASEELVHTPRRKWLDSRTIFLLILLAAAFLFPLWRYSSSDLNYWLNLGRLVFMYVAMASSWNIIGGYTGYVSLGHNVFAAVGAYFAGVLLAYHGVSPFISAAFAGVLAMALGLVVGLITLRTRGSAFIISTIAMVFLVRFAFEQWEYAGGTNGLSLPLIDLPYKTSKMPFYYGMLIIAILSVVTSAAIKRSKFGLGLRAISQDETKAEVAGIPTNMYKILAFAISGFYVGAAGALWGYSLTYLRPAIFLDISVAAQMVLITILGGKGTIGGPVVGAFLLIGLNEIMIDQLGSTELNIAAIGAIMLLILVLFPAGVVGTLVERNKLPRFLNWE